MHALLIVWCLLVFAFLASCGKFLSPATRNAFDHLVVMQVEVQRAHAVSVDPGVWNKRAEMLLAQLDEIKQTVKGSTSGSAMRDVARMERTLRTMINKVDEQRPEGDPADTPSEFEKSSKAFQDYRKAAAKKLGIDGK